MNKKMFNAQSTIGEVLKADSKNEEILLNYGMHCFGCPMSQMETMEEAAEVHEIDLQELLNKING